MQTEHREAGVGAAGTPATKQGSAGYPPASSWPAFGAAAAVVLIIATGMAAVAALVAAGVVAGIEALLVLQIVIAVATLWIANWYGDRRVELLSLVRVPTLVQWIYGAGLMAAILVPFNLVIWILAPEALTRDLQPFIKLARSDQAWVALFAVGVGAPVSEELIFRGFLLPALAKVAQIGFWGAALITTAGWTLLHLSYSVLGLIEVFTIGLLFCWLMRRFGSLWLAMGLHALYNAGQMIALMLIPL